MLVLYCARASVQFQGQPFWRHLSRHDSTSGLVYWLSGTSPPAGRKHCDAAGAMLPSRRPLKIRRSCCRIFSASNPGLYGPKSFLALDNHAGFREGIDMRLCFGKDEAKFLVRHNEGSTSSRGRSYFPPPTACRRDQETVCHGPVQSVPTNRDDRVSTPQESERSGSEAHLESSFSFSFVRLRTDTAKMAR